MDETTAPAPGSLLPPPQLERTVEGRRGGIRAMTRYVLRRSGRQAGETDPGIYDALDEIDQLIPPTLEDFHPDTGYRYRREKELDPPAVRRTMVSIFETLDDDSGSVELQSASEGLFSKLTIRNAHDTTDLARLDHFLAGYPRNIIDSLGEQGSARNLLTTIQVGEKLLDITEERSSNMFSSYGKGSIARLLGSKIPQFVAQEGDESIEKLAGIVSKHSIFAVEHYIDFRLRYNNELPIAPYTPEDIVGERAPDSPFVHEDASNAWSKEAQMGKQARTAEWGDLGQMLAITDQWDREYGLTIHQGDDGARAVNFVRGAEGMVKNKHQLERGGDKVFFHSHPRWGSGNGIFAPLVSSGDVFASYGFDHGGAYLNIVCGSGITLHIDSGPASPADPPGWVVESGAHKGEVISSDGAASTETRTILEQLHSLEEPFAYSINTTNVAFSPQHRKLLFVHIPWQHLETTNTTLQDVCFGSGLPKILPTGLPYIDNAPMSLHSAIQKAQAIESEAA